MAKTLDPKPATAVKFYSFTPELQDGDGIESYTLTPTTVAVDSDELNGDAIEFYVSGGTAGNVYTIAASVVTSFGETIKETLYLPVYGPGNTFAATADDVVDFALKPIVGLGETATSDELADGLEWLNGMLAAWRDQGADVGIALPLTLSSVMYCNDAHLLAIKTNLRVVVAEQYGREVSQTTMRVAMRGLQQIKHSLLTDERGAVDYF